MGLDHPDPRSACGVNATNDQPEAASVKIKEISVFSAAWTRNSGEHWKRCSGSRSESSPTRF